MNLIGTINAQLSKLVGPNAAHMIDALIGLAIVGAVALLSSSAARAFLAHHATLSVIVTAAVPVATALASKFRKAAGSQASLLDEIEQIVKNALAAQKTPASK